jgi:hypothetical protein
MRESLRDRWPMLRSCHSEHPENSSAVMVKRQAIHGLTFDHLLNAYISQGTRSTLSACANMRKCGPPNIYISVCAR